jgi:hypothetical protein
MFVLFHSPCLQRRFTSAFRASAKLLKGAIESSLTSMRLYPNGARLNDVLGNVTFTAEDGF